jgi:glycosyltransferase involved in cell wall biosynthesis
VSESDSGVYDAFNKGLTHSTGDVVGYLNAGDEYSGSGVIQTIVDEFNAKNVGAVFGDLVIVDPVDRAKIVRRYYSSWFNPSRVRFGFMPAHPTLFIRRDVYDRWGGYDTSFRIAGDFELVARLFVRHQVPYSYLPQVLVRMPSGGLSTSGLRANWIITSEMHRACSSNDIRTSLIRLLLRFPVKLTSLTLGTRE